jgi:putative transcriptional regulator
MKRASESRPFFQRLKTGLEEGIHWARGELTLQTTAVPGPPPELRAPDVHRLRRRLRMSQGVFARLLNVSLKTVQSWEQGERNPSQAARRLLQMLAEHPDLVCQVAGLDRNAGPAGEPARRSKRDRSRARGKR